MNSENCANDGRRFTLLVMERELLPQNGGLLVSGIIHGQIKTGDDVYLVDPAQRVLTAKVLGLSAYTGKGTTATEAAANQPVMLHLTPAYSKEEVPKYTVVTSLRPQQAINLDRGIENGQLVGLMMEFSNCSKDPEYMSVLVYSLCHSHLLAVTYLTGTPQTDAEGNVHLTAESNLEFPTLHDTKDANTTMLPVFTDWASLSLWKDIFQDTRKPRFTAMKFQNLVNVARNLNGAVVNAFGPGTLVLPNDFLERVIATKGYQEEFGPAAETSQVLTETKLDTDQQVRILVPKETEELQMIREEILSTLKNLPAVKEAYLMIKLNDKDEPAYYCVADCPKEEAKSIFAALARSTTPYLHQIKRIEFLPAAAISIPDSIAAVCLIYPENSKKAYANSSLLEKPEAVSLEAAGAQVTYEGNTDTAARNADYNLELNEQKAKEEMEKKGVFSKLFKKN